MAAVVLYHCLGMPNMQGFHRSPALVLRPSEFGDISETPVPIAERVLAKPPQYITYSRTGKV